MDETLNADGLPAGQPVTFEQIQRANLQRQMIDTTSPEFAINVQQQQIRQRKKRAEENQA